MKIEFIYIRNGQQFALICTTVGTTGHVITLSIFISSNSEGSKKLPDDGRLLP
jgi:hypothetical protein